jgi:hypothetical protein
VKSLNAPQRSPWIDGSSLSSDFVPTVVHCRHVITLQRGASSATDPDRSQLIQADSSLAAREASEERRNDVTGSYVCRTSAAYTCGLRRAAMRFCPQTRTDGRSRFCKFFRPINAKCRGIVAPTCPVRGPALASERRWSSSSLFRGFPRGADANRRRPRGATARPIARRAASTAGAPGIKPQRER